MKYAYPAVFTKEDNGADSVAFPDIEGCYTSGESLPEAIEMAEDALCLMLYDMEEENTAIPAASDLSSLPRKAPFSIRCISPCHLFRCAIVATRIITYVKRKMRNNT